jgi:UDP-glucose 4-epimerase
VKDLAVRATRAFRHAGYRVPISHRRMRHVLVTGATGCVGRALVRRLLQNGVRVRILVRDVNVASRLFDEYPGLDLVKGDLLDTSCLRRAVEGIDTIFHAAGKAHTRPRTDSEIQEFLAVNVGGTASLLDACSATALRAFVFFSTIAVNGAESAPFCESTPVAPVTPYGQSKHAAEQLVLQRFCGTDTASIILRLSMVFGEGDRGNFMRMVRAIHRGRFVPVGSAKKSLAYSENVADVAIAAAERIRVPGRTFVVADPESRTLDQLASCIANTIGVRPPGFRIPVWTIRAGAAVLDRLSGLSGFRMPLSSGDVEALTRETVCDISELQRSFDLRQRFSISEGIERTVRWYRNQLS